ncbi:phytoene/squalene synthase family protein [Nakamurella flavida]|uniref:Phytoene/squalene synthase family protein n=1 Tax=Nakamurella flavida TaxID=363630 RepID=A0A938YP60_9ACTN|nr:phytoene/squalene synthase family protein [Nakamurella flavida]MBM9476824.1 phytoene/squalene synthase family protein [Nakamurella flavida]MDP9778734.1 phytoene synthase [Nakamurella flavida]
MSVQAELTAAGIHDPDLRGDYRHCRRLAAEHGRTYFLATRFLPAGDRPAVHALYGFARTADDIVDDPRPEIDVASRTAGLADLAGQFEAGAAEIAAGRDLPIGLEPSVRSALHTADRYDLDPAWFDAFLESMRMDLTITEYATHADLDTYVYGSAAVIGLMTLPIMGAVGPVEEAAPYAADLGVAFQITNFIRDVGEDVGLGRIYLPQDSLAAHGVDRERLLHAASIGRADAPIRALLAAEIDRTRGIYRRAEPGIALLSPAARACVQVAYRLYGDILTAIEDADYEVFGERVRVTRRHRARVAASGLATGVAGAARARLAGSRRAG